MQTSNCAEPHMYISAPSGPISFLPGVVDRPLLLQLQERAGLHLMDPKSIVAY